MESTGYWTQLSGTRSSRRRFLARSLGIGSGLASAALIGCGRSGGGGAGKPAAGGGGVGGAFATSTAVAGADKPRRGGVFVMNQANPLNDIKDPHKSSYEASWIHQQLANRAVYLNKDNKIEPELFASWEQVSPTVMVFKTQPNAKFHNKGMEAGRVFTAEDAAFNLMRNAGLLDKPENAAQYQRAPTQAGMDKAEAVDKTTVKVTFKRPTSTFLAGLSDYRNGFLSKERLVAGAFKEVEQVGTGPFIITKWDNGVEAVFERNPDYWEAGMPYVDGFKFLFISDFNAQAVALQQGKLSTLFARTTVQRATIEKLVPNAIDNSYVSANWNHMQFRVRPPFDDERVRRAIFLVPNYVDMGNVLYGDKWRLSGPIASFYPEAWPAAEIAAMPGYNAKTKDADIKTAKELMTAAGYPDGAIKLGLMTNAITGETFENGIRIQDALKAVWPKMNVFMDHPADGATDAKRRVTGDFDASLYSQYEYADVFLEMGASIATGGQRNYGRVSDPKADALIQQGFQALDPAARLDVAKQLGNYLLTKQYTLILSTPMNTYKEVPTMRGMVGTFPPLGCAHVEPMRAAKRAWFAPA